MKKILKRTLGVIVILLIVPTITGVIAYVNPVLKVKDTIIDAFR